MTRTAARTARDLLILSAACALIYLPGLTLRGLINWQEAQRALVAREMHARGEWIVPTAHGEPYLAKPPLIYWCQLGLAELRGGPPGEADLRLTVAIAGWLGVLATYVAARRLLSPESADPAPPDADFARRAGFWSALLLATGILYVRASRIGELDILLVPFTVAAIGAIYAAWRSYTLHGRTNWTAVTVATAAAIGAMMAKGPPGLLAIALGGYGGIALHVVARHLGAQVPRPDALDGHRTVTDALRSLYPGAQRVLLGAAAGGLVFIGAGAWFSWSDAGWSDRILGLMLFDVMGDAAGALIALITVPAVAGTVFAAYARTHPVAVLGVPFVVLWTWLRAARTRIGGEPVLAAMEGEARDNLRLFVLESPVTNLGAASYALGAGSLAAIIACIWLARSRPRIGPGAAFILAWAGLSLIAFSILGKGVGRYLTPIWPAVAMLGGAWLAWTPRPRGLRMIVAAGAIAGGSALAVWYGWIGARPQMTPRELIAELRAPPYAIVTERLATFEFTTSQVDYYAQRRVECLTDSPPDPRIPATGRTIADLRDQLAAEPAPAPFTLLIRRMQPDFLAGTAPALDRIRAAGLEAEPIPLTHRFVTDNRRTEIIAVRVRPR